MNPFDIAHDPYKRCEQHCNHDLARGVTLDELLEGDGPYPTIVAPTVARPGDALLRTESSVRLAG